MEKISLVTRYILVFVFAYFIYHGITTTPKIINESDSLDYHIPIAQNFVRGNFTDLTSITQGLGFYPAVGETILAVFIFLHLPLGFYNVLACIILYVVSGRLGIKAGLNKIESHIFSFSICLFPAVIRLIPNQTVDIWLLIFFLVSLNLLLKIENKIAYFLMLGSTLGLLVGVKYSGILLATVLVIVFFKKKLISSKIFFTLVPILLFGFVWYIRNYVATGNPFYPVPLFGFRGDPNFTSQTWTGLKVFLIGKEGIWLMLQACVSEFLIWSMIPGYVLYEKLIKKVRFDKVTVKLMVLAIFTFLIFLLEPSWPNIQVTQSNMRFLLPTFTSLILATFLSVKSLGNSHKLAILAIIALASSLGVLSLFKYYPKLIVGSLVGFVLIYKLYESFTRNHSIK